jgi:histidinol phosphatase-like PHP family hydrolase
VTVAGARPGALGTQDLHAHSTLSDGDLPPGRVAALAAERGVQIGIADHVSTRNAERFVSSLAAVERYLDEIGALPVFVAGEFCWRDGMWRDLPAEVMERFDYRIGSNHGFSLPGGGEGSPWWKRLPAAWEGRADEVMEAMVGNLCEMVRTMPVQIAAHSTLTPPALFALEPDVHAWWTDEREDRWVQALAASGVALEISNRYRLPHDRLLRKARQAGVRFTLGSDGHTEAQVGRLEWAAETARRVGVGDADLWVPERRRRG